MDQKRCEYGYHNQPPVDPEWEKRFDKFTEEMKNKIKLCIPRKGTTWLASNARWLSTEASNHAFLGHDVDAANFFFMLWDQKQLASNSSKQTEAKE